MDGNPRWGGEAMPPGSSPSIRGVVGDRPRELDDRREGIVDPMALEYATPGGVLEAAGAAVEFELPLAPPLHELTGQSQLEDVPIGRHLGGRPEEGAVGVHVVLHLPLEMA